MITVSELIGESSCADELSNLKLWEMDVDDVMPAHLQGFFYRSKLRTTREIAKNCANFIAKSITTACKENVVRNNRLANFIISEPPYLASELRLSLEEMDLPSRRCIYFSLLMGWSIEKSLSLDWHEVNRMINAGEMYHNDAAVDVLDALPRHFKSKLVFWRESKQGTPVSLVGLKLDVDFAFDCTYEELLQKFQTMVLVDPAIHAIELKQIWENANG